jgi:glycosyltransferase involved in cell wall biosynthesis
MSFTRLASSAGLAASALTQPDTEARVVLHFDKRDRQVTGDPLVSIAIPAYRPTFFRSALESALAQTYRATEIIVCDDSEGEDIATIVRECDTAARVRFVRNASRLGGRGNYRQGLVLAQGEFVKFLNDDDELLPDCVERLVGAFRAAPDVTLATSHRQRIDATGALLPDQAATMRIVEADTLIEGVSLANVMLMTPLNVVGEPSTVLFRKSDLADLAPDYFRFQAEEGRGVIDMTLWATLLLRGDAVYLRESLSRFRIHADQQQSDASLLRRSAAATRALQGAWRLLGLHRRGDPFTLRTKPHPFDADADWTEQRVRSFQAISLSSLTERSA